MALTASSGVTGASCDALAFTLSAMDGISLRGPAGLVGVAAIASEIRRRRHDLLALLERGHALGEEDRAVAVLLDRGEDAVHRADRPNVIYPEPRHTVNAAPSAV